MAKNPRLIDLSGQRFSRWTVQRQAGNTERGAALWACTCDCGTLRDVPGADLRNGKSVSCGCLRSERIGNLRRSHAATGSRLYETWKGMHSRCRAKAGDSFKNYGSRGIAVCQEWSHFVVFRDWALSSGYADDLTIEREDVNGNYEPSNCTWIPKSSQAINRRFVQRAPDGELWWHKARTAGITATAYRQRLGAGWPYEQAVSWPMRTLRRPRSRDQSGRYA